MPARSFNTYLCPPSIEILASRHNILWEPLWISQYKGVCPFIISYSDKDFRRALVSGPRQLPLRCQTYCSTFGARVLRLRTCHLPYICGKSESTPLKID